MVQPVPRPGRRAARTARTARTARAARTARTARALAGLAATAALLLPVTAHAAPPPEDALRRAYGAAAREYGVPEALLLALGYLHSRWEHHDGAPSVAGGHGSLHLRDGGDGWATVERAAGLTGLSAGALRTDPAANAAGGAALLAEAQRGLGLPAGADPADWYGAVARYSGAGTAEGAAAFADEVYAVLAEGPARRTSDGQELRLPAAGRQDPATGQLALLGLPAAADATGSAAEEPPPECPADVSCVRRPAAYEEYPGADGEPDYGNHDKADRPASQRIEYLVLHTVEGYFDSMTDLVRDPRYLSWHYTLRSSDGLIAQHLPTADIGWHAGNWYVNTKSIGIEHEGFLAEPGTWYTEAMYRASARLVRHLAALHDIPLDRAHVLGHHNVPPTLPENASGMHNDPGPYWDWAHYFDLLGAPFADAAGADPEGPLVVIDPPYDGGTGADFSGVALRTSPDPGAPLLGNSSLDIGDTGARAAAGQTFVVAEERGEWLAIWFEGRKGWFHNPPGAPTAHRADGPRVTGASGTGKQDTVPVYGRAYPEAAAYPEDLPPEPVTPIAEVPADQEYALGLTTDSEFLAARSFDPARHRVVRGETYHQIQLGHRIGYVRVADVRVLPAAATAGTSPPAAASAAGTARR
ncbi:N-acetylmuramoyl-L-alanine amidase [Streptomyces cheonanensis]|uniref:N-acetylmuramoyl-L-alanine amidase n=1 Tax=Streptomyces cheonanensis TaxID=312720 RepID=A0ABN2VFS8_9ACTN